MSDLQEKSCDKVYFHVIAYLKEEMQKGNICFGGKIPSERELMNRLGLGRNSVREALRTMEHMGLIESRQGKGNFLVNRMGESLSSVFSMFLLMKQSNYQEIIQLRKCLETEALRILNRDDVKAKVTELRKCLDQMNDSDVQQCIQADKRFHQVLIQNSSNHLLETLMQVLSGLCEEQIEHMIQHNQEKVKAYLYQVHRELIQALENKDIDTAVHTLEKHYEILQMPEMKTEEQNEI